MNVLFVSALFPPPTYRPRIILRDAHRRAWKRHRVKANNVRCLLNPTPPPFEDLFHSLLSQVSSVNSFDYVAPALGLVSGLALYFYSNSSKTVLNPTGIASFSCDFGEWILFTSPTPFNRFATLRCPSICFPGNEKLVEENGNLVKLNTGRMIGVVKGDCDVDGDIEYQRVCVGTSDGGVLSLDWPAHLDMEEESGLDTTVFIVPGTAEGSKEKKIKLFVFECLKRGTFPVVMNPRGCAHSPLTTARFFSAADSDDVLTAVKFINKKRPLSTLMGVGWGYGANMLTKHLAEYGEKTPLTAASCIDNPFDLEEVTKSFYHKGCFQRLKDGLIKILQRNKELFQGPGKGFNIERALSASSIRDLDQAISVVSNGVDTIEDFYAMCSTRHVVGKVKVPALFIQNGDGNIPTFSVPKDLIAENPYTSLLLCIFPPSREIADDQFPFSWCQNLTLEWLAAVELGLLKGRHPLLEDSHIRISTSKGLSVSENGAPSSKRVEKQLKPANNISAFPPIGMVPGDDMNMKFQSRYEKTTRESFTSRKTLEREASNADDQSNSTEPVVQAVHVALNMLDVTLPGTLSDEQKKKVLNAVGQGETLLQALQDAVPEEVRGKITSAVSAILNSKKGLGEIPDVSLGRSFEVLQKLKQTKQADSKDGHQLDNGVDSVQKQLEIPPDSRSVSGKSTDDDINGASKFDKVNTNKVQQSDGLEALSGGVPHQASDAEASGVTDPNKVPFHTFEGSGEAEGYLTDQGTNTRNEDVLTSSGDSPPRFSVSQALDALTGLDDSTQAAVNSVFHVIEDMINKLEVKDKENKASYEKVTNEIERTVEVKESSEVSLSDDAISKSGCSSRKAEDLEVRMGEQSGNLELNVPNDGETSRDGYENQHFSQYEGSTHNSFKDHTSSEFQTEDDIHFLPSDGEQHTSDSANSGLKKNLSDLYKDFLNAYLYMKVRNPISAIDRIPALYLHYFPDEDKWKLLDQSEENNSADKRYPTSVPFSAAVDSGKSMLQIAETKGVKIAPDNFEFGSIDLDDCKAMIRNAIFECLKVEVSLRINMVPMEVVLKLSKEIEYVSNVVVAVLHNRGCIHKEDCNQEQEIEILDRDSVTVAILAALQKTEYLRLVVPAGVLIGTIFVELFAVAPQRTGAEKHPGLDEFNNSPECSVDEKHPGHDDINNSPECSLSEECSPASENSQVMLGAITASLGSSAFLARQPNTGIGGTSNSTQEKKEDSKEPSKPVGRNEKAQNNIVTNLAEKAISVTSPIVPMKEDGQLDQDRMVAMLTELGQKGGFLKPFGKVGLLWGGVRGAMSLADKLILFLRIAERPLSQRILSFASMVLLLWLPVILPFFPTLMQSWASNKPFKVVEFSCTTGLYISTMIMTTLWGKRIRKYDDPLMQYGLNLTSASEFRNFLKALIGGISLVMLIHTLNSMIGCTSIRWPTTLSSSATGPVALVGSYARTLFFAVQGLAIAIGASVVEELLFRSWLPQEIAADLGYHYGIVISGLIFALSQRSKLGFPGLWLLSLCLSGVRERSQGSLSVAIGLRAGIRASNFILRTGGFLYYHPNFPPWVTGGQPFQPFSGVVGLAFSFLLAVILYPTQKKADRVIRPY